MRRQYLKRPLWASWIAFAGRLLLVLEDALEEFNVDGIHVSRNVVEDRVPRVIRVSSSPPVDGLEEYVESRVEGVDVNALNGDGIPHVLVYRRVLEVYRSHMLPLLLNYSLETDATGVEYYASVVEGGELVVLEGEEGRVSIPFIRSWATGHTHPSGRCMFSSKDLRSLRDFYTHGGLASGVVTRTCSIVLWREGPYTMDDHVALIRLEGDMKRVSGSRELMEALRRFASAAANLRIVWVKPRAAF